LSEADPTTPPDQRQFRFQHNELGTLFRLLLQPLGWLANPLQWKMHGPSAMGIEYPSRDGWRICFHLPAAESRGEEMEFVPPGVPNQGIPADRLVCPEQRIVGQVGQVAA
jgi:hypothetical protein